MVLDEMSVDKMTYSLWQNTSYRFPLSSRGIFNGQVYNLVYKYLVRLIKKHSGLFYQWPVK
jgi:hypothetical protein